MQCCPWRWLVLCLALVLVQAAMASPSPQHPIVLTFNDTLVSTTEVPESTASPIPIPTPTPELTNDVREILRKVGSLPCVEPTRSRMFALMYGSNVALHDACIADSKYQFFPYTTKLPTTTQLLAIVKSTACMAIFAGVILAHFPECDIDFVSARSSAEAYYRVKRDIDAGRVPPTQAQFYELYNLNRVVNLLSENASLVEEVFRTSPTTAAVSLSEMTRLMNPIVLLPGVTLSDNMTVTMATASPPLRVPTNRSDSVTVATQRPLEVPQATASAPVVIHSSSFATRSTGFDVPLAVVVWIATAAIAME